MTELEMQTPERLLEAAEAAIRLARGSHGRMEAVTLVRADLLQARELVTLALAKLEANWQARGESARRQIEGIERERKGVV